MFSPPDLVVACAWLGASEEGLCYGQLSHRGHARTVMTAFWAAWRSWDTGTSTGPGCTAATSTPALGGQPGRGGGITRSANPGLSLEDFQEVSTGLFRWGDGQGCPISQPGNLGRKPDDAAPSQAGGRGATLTQACTDGPRGGRPSQDPAPSCTAAPPLASTWPASPPPPLEEDPEPSVETPACPLLTVGGWALRPAVQGLVPLAQGLVPEAPVHRWR